MHGLGFALASFFAATISTAYAASCDWAYDGLSGTGVGPGEAYSCSSEDFVIFAYVCNGAEPTNSGPWCCSGEFFPATEFDPAQVGDCLEI
ncbi:hypothetical protein BDP27DRAFT_219344 [Rhodocollybia butyracea]|uniref:Uncharacterized protein n=1 Tax=Rhodocollybia butyracea TaxID=206335 RepID=A0A9P5PX53_9AGAR|nr:hypothetical protein BDP27DRAFT_219344 [Rhodocollybia butyracea]